MLRLEDVRPYDLLDDESERAVDLVCEITQLIDGCEGLRCAEWDELIAMLEEEQNAFKDVDVDEDEGPDSLDDVELMEPRGHDAVDDWELVT